MWYKDYQGGNRSRVERSRKYDRYAEPNDFDIANGKRGYYTDKVMRYDKPKVKHSGCKIVYSKLDVAKKSDNPRKYFSGWNVSKRNGLVTFIASPSKDSKTKSATQLKFVVKITFNDEFGRTMLTTGFLNTKSGKLTMPDLKMVANPNAPNGGYWGTVLK